MNQYTNPQYTSTWNSDTRMIGPMREKRGISFLTVKKIKGVSYTDGLARHGRLIIYT